MTRHPPVIALAMALAGCMTVGPDYERPAVDLPGAYPEPIATASAPLEVPADWWRLFGDATLDRLVTSGLERNADIRVAVARIEEAEAALREARATALFPLVEGNAGISRARSSTQTGTLPPNAAPIRNNFQLAASTSFELDFWGRLRRTVEAVRAQLLATRYGREVVSLSLTAAIAQTYFAARSLDAQLMVSRETLKAAEESVSLARARAQAGVVSDLDVYQADANRAQLAAQLKELQRQRNVAVHQLGVLSGMLDLDLDERDLSALPIPPLPPAGLPSTLLERRPDLRQAEAQLVAANAQIGVARAAQLPTFSLTGMLGVQSRELATLFTHAAGIWSAGLGVMAPIIDGGRYAARTEQAEARARQAVATYEKTARTGFREVADALSNVRLAAEAEQDLRDRVEQAGNNLRIASLRYESGYSAYLEVLDAQRTLNDAQLALVRNRQSYLGYTVDLMNALGGGWPPFAS